MHTCVTVQTGGGAAGGEQWSIGSQEQSNEAPANKKLRPEFAWKFPSMLYVRSMHPMSSISNMTERAFITPFKTLGLNGLSQPKPRTFPSKPTYAVPYLEFVVQSYPSGALSTTQSPVSQSPVS